MLTSDLSFSIPEITNIIIRITNEQKAWTEYNQTVTVQPFVSPFFENLSNYTVYANKTTELNYPLSGNLKVVAVDCLKAEAISWIKLDAANSKFIVDSNFMPTPNQCVRLKSLDS